MLGELHEGLVVCHRIPGRLRIKIASIRDSKDVSRQLEGRLHQIDGIERAEARFTTGSVILIYDQDRIKASQLIQNVTESLRNLPKNSWDKSEAGCARNLTARNSVPTSPSILYHFLNAIALGGFLIYSVLRSVFFKSPLSQRPFSLTGIVAGLGALPLFLRAWNDIRQERTKGLFPFLAAGCGLAILTGEALTALEIIWVLAIGMLLEEYVTDRARRAIRQILQVSPPKTFVLVKGVEVEAPVNELRRGDTVVVHTGRKIPADGVVLDGEALVDEAHITGRSQPELRRSDDWVYAGTQVQEGFLLVRADKLGEETYLCRIGRMVEQALGSRTEVEKKADLLAVRLTRIGIVATVATFILTRSIARAFSVMLVMACPCATVLAASTAVAAAVANAARQKILIKGGLYLEKISTVDCFCFDKTGTITSDLPEVIEVVPRSPTQDPSKIIAMAADAEAQSDHPAAKALIEEARNRGFVRRGVSTCEMFLGRGVRAISGPDILLVGNREFMGTENIKPSYFKKKAQKHMESGRTVLYVARNGKLQGMVAIANTLRPGTDSALEALHKRRTARFYLISGDTEPIVKKLAMDLGFDNYKAALLPEQKARYIEKLKKHHRGVLMVGDGVNDALAMSTADVGVAMGAGGSEVAIEASDIALVRSDLRDLVTLRLLSDKTLRTIETNFWIATVTNGVGILLGAMGWLTPVMAGVLHIGHTLGIMGNSSRLLKWEAGVLAGHRPDGNHKAPLAGYR